MGRGIKISKCATFDIHYEVYPKSGSTTMGSGEDSYIIGVGLDELAYADHEAVKVEQLNDNLTVGLQSDETLYQNKPTGNKTLKEGEFSNPVSSVSADESGDLDLKAKGVQYIGNGDVNYTRSDIGETGISISLGDVIFQGEIQ